MNFVCPHCTECIVVDDSVAGSELTCPHCQKQCQAPRQKIRLRLSSDGPAPAPVANGSQAQCPQCKVAMAADAVFCVKCGFDLRTGKNVSMPAVGPRPSRKRLILSVVCVLIILVALVRIYAFLHEPKYPSLIQTPVMMGRSNRQIGTNIFSGPILRAPVAVTPPPRVQNLLAAAPTQQTAGKTNKISSVGMPQITARPPQGAGSAWVSPRLRFRSIASFNVGAFVFDRGYGPGKLESASYMVEACPVGPTGIKYLLPDSIEYPGKSVRRDYVVRWRMTEPKKEYIVKLSVVRPPLPCGLKAQSWDDRIELTWNRIDWKPEDWITPPTVAIMRATVDVAPDRPLTMQGIHWKPIAKLSGQEVQYVDKTVESGRSYFFALQVTGVSHANSWSAENGLSESELPVDAWTPPGFTGLPLMATPIPSRPLRVALLTDSTAEPIVNATLLEFYRSFNKTPWIELVERSAAASLLDEKQLQALQVQRVTEAAALGLKTARSADVILRLHPRQAGPTSRLDFWLDDLWQGQRERVASFDLSNLDAHTAAEIVKADLAKRFPHYAQAKSAQPIDTCGPIKRIAVIGLLPVASKGPAGENVADILTSALSHQECLHVVDREEIRRVLEEQVRGNATDLAASLKLGRLVDAQAIVSGFYGVDGQLITLSVRVIEVGSGAVLKVIDLEGKLAELDKLGQQLATEIITASQSSLRGVDDPAMRWLEAAVYQRDRRSDQSVKTAAYVAPENPDHDFQLGQEAQGRGDHGEALAHFTRGLAVAEKSSDPWRFYVALSDELRETGATEDEIALWRRAVQDRQAKHKDLNDAQLRLADALQHASRYADAGSVLDQIQKPSYTQGRLYEQCGLTNSAVRVYESTDELSLKPMATTPCYAALIRLMEQSPLGRDPGFLQSLITTALKGRPYAQLLIWHRLAEANVSDTNVLAQIAQAALTVREFSVAGLLWDKLADQTTNSLVKLISIRLLVPQQQLVTRIGCYILRLGICKQFCHWDLLKRVNAQNL